MTISEPSVHGVSSYDNARAVLEQPLLVPEPAADAADSPVGSLAWLRATVARFTGDAQVHGRRRAHAEAGLAGLEPEQLRRAAAGSTPGADDRHAVVRTLAQALGLPGPDAVAEAVVAVSAGYFGGTLTPVEAKAADEAVALLLAHVADEEDLEAAAQLVGLLVQACDATARLVEHARRAGLPASGTEGILDDVLRHDPPVPALRRRAVTDVRAGELQVRSGDAVLIDVTATQKGAADLLVFGAGPHRCPGRAHALALAAGLLERDGRAGHVATAPGS
ncbi:hypothetical protein PUR71_36045 [Streptomyces sp. SP17BM10]|uniref:hypothetical protein n=1 Tax=Streptomyces sp. SP17BM10 TaxID=3002530 RepID=UPI002E78FB5C|nr:hypothetical protein [Streptomyces sp. SP17BM10]MEE1788270.1 hypothetical protein [Streptomyces sp. SP17BM10]